MKKLLSFLLLLVMGASFSLKAQSSPIDASFDISNVKLWFGNGHHRAVLAVSWTDSSLAWGCRFGTDTITAEQMLDVVADADPRFSYSSTMGAYGPYLLNIMFAVSEGDTLKAAIDGNWWSNLDGRGGMGLPTKVGNGQLMKWGDVDAGIGYDSVDYGYGVFPSEYVFTQPIKAVRGYFSDSVGSDNCDAVAADGSIVLWAIGCVVERGYQDISVAGARASYGAESDAVGPVDMNDNLHVVSLGDGGSATLTFDGAIYNGEGPDFVVFENAFDNNFLELAFVEVSSDGEHFVRFPATSLTDTSIQTGPFSSTDPTFINNLAGKHRMGYGTPFDLEELRGEEGVNIDSITHVRVVDVVGSVDARYASYDADGRAVNDPYPTNFASSGFDLAGVGVIHAYNRVGIDNVHHAEAVQLFPNPAKTMVRCHNLPLVANNVEVLDATGRVVLTSPARQGSATLSVSHLPQGVYMIKACNAFSRLVIAR